MRAAALAGGVAELLLVVILLLSPIPNGSLLEGPGDARWQTILDASLYLVFLLILLEARLAGRSLVRPAPWFPVAILMAYVALQLVPLPRAVVGAISPATTHYSSQAGGAGSWITLSLVPQMTLLELLRLGAYLAALMVVVNRFRTLRACARLAAWITAVGAIMAVLAFVQRATSPDDLLMWTWKLERWGTIFGPYINKNHFAGLMEICMGAALALLLLQAAEMLRGLGEFSLGAKVGILLGRGAPRVLFPFLAFCVMAAGLVASRSRGGWLGMGLAGLAFVLYLGIAKRERAAFKVAIVLAIGVVAVSLLVGTGDLTTRFQVQDRAINRPRIWADSLRLWQDFPLLGSGAGTFLYAFQPYHSFPDRRLALHPEMDYLQLLTGLGAIGMILLLWAGVRTVKAFRRGFERTEEDEVVGPGVTPETLFLGGILTGMGAILVHGFLDVNLQIPANGLLFTVLAGLGLAAARALAEHPRPKLVDSPRGEEGTEIP
jgi:hypothetical protein